MCDGLWVSDDHPEQGTRIRHLNFAEHWKMGMIAAERGLHHETVRSALETDRFNRGQDVAGDPGRAPFNEKRPARRWMTRRNADVFSRLPRGTDPTKGHR